MSSPGRVYSTLFLQILGLSSRSNLSPGNVSWCILAEANARTILIRPLVLPPRGSTGDHLRLFQQLDLPWAASQAARQLRSSVSSHKSRSSQAAAEPKTGGKAGSSATEHDSTSGNDDDAECILQLCDPNRCMHQRLWSNSYASTAYHKIRWMQRIQPNYIVISACAGLSHANTRVM